MRLPERPLPPAAARQVSGACPSCGHAHRVGGRRRCAPNRRRRTCSGGSASARGPGLSGHSVQTPHGPTPPRFPGICPESRFPAQRRPRRHGPLPFPEPRPRRSRSASPDGSPTVPGVPALIHAAGPSGLMTSHQPGDCDFSPQPACSSPRLHGFSKQRAQTHPSQRCLDGARRLRCRNGPTCPVLLSPLAEAARPCPSREPRGPGWGPEGAGPLSGRERLLWPRSAGAVSGDVTRGSEPRCFLLVSIYQPFGRCGAGRCLAGGPAP